MHIYGNGHGFGLTLGAGDGQGGLACGGSWDRKESDMTEQLNWTELNVLLPYYFVITVIIIILYMK